MREIGSLFNNFPKIETSRFLLREIDYEGKKIGYVNLYYLIPEKRGQGL